MASRLPEKPQGQARAQALAHQVRTLRENREWSRERLAKEAGVQVRTLARLESAGATQAGFFTVGAIANALGVTLDEIFRSSVLHPGLWSTGYEGRSIESFISRLLESRIDSVADVRLTPISRKVGFSKTRLGQALAEAGIEYTHLRSLGNPKDNRAPFWEGRVAEGRARFRSRLGSEEAKSALDLLAERAANSRIAVLCFEKDEERCHRKVVLDAVRHRAPVTITPLA
jgi:transcriptional regulator with XRE-family HTH domain